MRPFPHSLPSPPLFLLLPFLMPGCSGGDQDPVSVADMAILDMAILDMATSDATLPREMDTGVRGIGERCGNPRQCGEEAACTGDELERNFRCMAGCTEPGRICQGGEVCVALSQSATLPAVCFLGGGVPEGVACGSNLECASGYSCFGTQSERFCIKACHLADKNTCGEGSTCLANESGRGFCRPLTSRGCEQDGDCVALDATLVCSTSLQAQGAGALLPTPSCTKTCTDDASCPAGATCRGLKGGAKLCLTRCQRDASCRFNQGNRCMTQERCAGSNDPEACEALFAPAPTEGLCLGSVDML